MNTLTKTKFVALLLLSRLVATTAVGAVGEDFLIDRDRIEISGAPDPSARFTVRLTEIDTIKTAEATVGGKPAETTLTPVEDAKTSVYFLIDASEQKGGQLVKEQTKAVSEFADLLLADSKAATLYSVGIGTIGSKFTDWGYSLPSKDAREAILEKVATAKPEPTSEIYRCGIEAMGKFSSQAPDGRKVLVLLSSGKSMDTDKNFSAEKWIELARAQGIPVFVIGYAVDAAGSSAWQTLRTVAKETGGAFIETTADKKPVSDPFTEFLGMTKTARHITVSLKDVPAGKQPMVVDLGLNGGAKLKMEREIEVPAPAPPATPDEVAAEEPGKPAEEVKPAEEETKPVGKAETAEIPIWKKYMTEPWFLPAAVGCGVLCLALIGFLIYKMTRKPEPRPFPAADDAGIHTAWEIPPAIFNDTPDSNQDYDPMTAAMGTLPIGNPVVYGWLEQIDKAGNTIERHPMTEGKVAIGRSSDNDLAFDHESVSVHHATVHRRSDCSLAVTDLRSSNGVYLNNKRVEHSVLMDGDVIEFGEIRLRVIINPNGN